MKTKEEVLNDLLSGITAAVCSILVTLILFFFVNNKDVYVIILIVTFVILLFVFGTFKQEIKKWKTKQELKEQKSYQQ